MLFEPGRERLLLINEVGSLAAAKNANQLTTVLRNVTIGLWAAVPSLAIMRRSVEAPFA